MQLNQNVQVLQNWFSASFPIGAFAYSHGLETAIQNNVVTDPNTLTDWLEFILKYGSGYNDGLCLKATYQGEDVNQLCLSLSAGHERELETLEQGCAFATAVNKSYGLSLPNGLAYPIAVGMASAQLHLDLLLTLQCYLQGFAANMISVGARSIPIGQIAAQKCLVEIFPIIKTLAIKLLQTPLTDIGGCAVFGDLMSLQHEENIPRLYRT